MEADDEALKVRERQEVKVKVQRSLQEAEAQSFQLYHPQVDQAIRKKEELHKALREHREPTPGPRPGSGKELVTDEMLDNEMAILAPLQEGMQALPAEEVANEGARALRSTWSDSRPSCKISTWRARVSTPARHWLMRWAPFRRRRRRTSAPRTPTRHGCLTTPSSPWRCRHGQMISRGCCSAPWSWMTSRTSPTWGTSRRSTSPTSGGSERHRTRGTRRRCWKRCAIWRHQLRMFGGIWKKHSSGEIPKGADQQFKLSPEELLAGPTHSRVSGTTSTRSSTRPWRSERR